MPSKQHTGSLVVVACCLTLATLLIYPGEGMCQFPERPVTIIVGNEAGGTADLITRALVIGTEKYLGKPIVVENKGG